MTDYRWLHARFCKIPAVRIYPGMVSDPLSSTAKLSELLYRRVTKPKPMIRTARFGLLGPLKAISCTLNLTPTEEALFETDQSTVHSNAVGKGQYQLDLNRPCDSVQESPSMPFLSFGYSGRFYWWKHPTGLSLSRYKVSKIIPPWILYNLTCQPYPPGPSSVTSSDLLERTLLASVSLF